jgi:replication factor C subunit 3/5
MLPWVEKHRPHTLEDLMMDESTRTLFKRMIETKTFPHMLFYGPPGTGKTSTILCILQHLKQTEPELNVIHLNASDDRGVDIIRNQIQTFIQSKGFLKGMRFIVLDEIDSMTKQAQQCLLTLILNTRVRFCLICNYLSKLIQPLRDYVLLIPFHSQSYDRTYLKTLMRKENLSLTDEVLEDIVYTYYPDMRSCVNCLQVYQSIPYPILEKKQITHTLERYDKAELVDYLADRNKKEFFQRLFLSMVEYTITSELVTRMHKFILLKQDMNYLDEFIMKEFVRLNPMKELS